MNVQTAYDALKCCFIKRERERKKEEKSYHLLAVYFI